MYVLECCRQTTLSRSEEGAQVVASPSFGIPRVNDANARTFKVLDVSRCDGRIADSGNRCDLAVRIHDRLACLRAARGRNLGVATGSGAVKWQDAAREVLIDHRVNGTDEAITSLTGGQDRSTGANCA